MRKGIEVMRVRLNRLFVGAVCCFVGLAFYGCANEPTLNTSPTTNAQNGTAKPSPSVPVSSNAPASPSDSPRPPGGEPIDTSNLDKEVARAAKALKQKPNDVEARASLAHAYLARADALKTAKQYRAALGDYRRTLKYDPDNAEAREMSETIISILQVMKRDVPAEGQEPPPLPFKKEGEKTKQMRQRKLSRAAEK
jgi:tetratricopeptide (TPR) repeat protein